jgi:hypothetical protein
LNIPYSLESYTFCITDATFISGFRGSILYRLGRIPLRKESSKHRCAIEGGDMQNISVMGMISRIFDMPQLSVLMVLVPAGIIMLLPLIRFKQYGNQNFRLYYVAAILLSPLFYSVPVQNRQPISLQ